MEELFKELAQKTDKVKLCFDKERGRYIIELWHLKIYFGRSVGMKDDCYIIWAGDEAALCFDTIGSMKVVLSCIIENDLTFKNKK